MKSFKGVIIEGSLKNKKILQRIAITSTKVEQVTERNKTPWLTQWTLHTVEIPADAIQKFVEEISGEVQDKPNSWYADFNNGNIFYVVYPYKVFRWKKGEKEKVKACKAYGSSLGIPEHQLDFPMQ